MKWRLSALTFSILIVSVFSTRLNAKYIFDENDLGFSVNPVDLNKINSGGQLPGVYNVSVWINDKQVDSGNIVFHLAKESYNHDGTVNLVPCLTPKKLLSYGVDIIANPDLLNYESGRSEAGIYSDTVTITYESL
ncbi:hypothetical protein BSW63_22930 [Salmonella enterica subsp. enterica serovar Enteritidis]|nr:hypothetical protein [Salmonella enterica subsp. enterica serovar Enteritidis]